MPLVAVNLAQATFSEVMTLVGQGAYASPEQFLEIAAFNQLALERGLSPQELMKGIHRPANASEAVRKIRTAPVAAAEQSSSLEIPVVAEKLEKALRALPRQSKKMAIPTAEDRKAVQARLSLETLQELTVTTLPPDEEATRSRVWGQVNRLFPMKLACRWIAVSAANNHEWPQLRGALDGLAEDAATIGSILDAIDSKKSSRREEMLATGLPRKGNLQSCDRFIAQFIARLTRSDRCYPGAICQYGFAVLDGDRLTLTNHGLALAKLPNPILDEEAEDAVTTLTMEERALFVDIISTMLPAERSDFSVILKAIAGGNSNPESLLSAVAQQLPQDWSDLAKRTHVYGVLARLGDLRFLGKEWQGRNVTYRLNQPLPAFAA